MTDYSEILPDRNSTPPDDTHFDVDAELIALDAERKHQEKRADDLSMQLDRLRGEFQGHSQAAVDLYDDIYRIVESTRGTRVPEGCSPREAVSLMAGELSASRHDYRKMRNERDDLSDQLEEAIKMIPTNGLTDREAIRTMIRIKAGQ